MFYDLHIIVTFLASVLILSDFLINVYKNRKNIAVIDPCSNSVANNQLNDNKVIISFTFNENSNCSAEVLINRQLKIKEHKNFLVVVEELLKREREIHEILKKREKDKFQLIKFRKDDEIS